MDILLDYYQCIPERQNIQNISEYLKSFKEILKKIHEYDKSFQDNKIKMIQDIINMLNYVNVDMIIKSVSLELIGKIAQYKMSYQINEFKTSLVEIELRSGILTGDLNIETYFKQNERIGFHMLKMKDINNSTKYILYNINNLYELYECILNSIKRNTFLKLNIDNIESLIKNLDNIETQVSNINSEYECYEYYSTRRHQTIEIWKLLQDEFFEISYRPDMFKKIVLDEKEVCLFAN